MNSNIPEFGKIEPDVQYIHRPGSYGLVFDDSNRLLVVVTPNGMIHLPGCGRNGIETPEENLRRELKEECGIDADNTTFVATAIQYLHALGEGYFKKVCDYYLVETSLCSFQTKENHVIQWMAVDDALRQLSHESHRYGLRTARDQSSKCL